MLLIDLPAKNHLESDRSRLMTPSANPKVGKPRKSRPEADAALISSSLYAGSILHLTRSNPSRDPDVAVSTSNPASILMESILLCASLQGSLCSTDPKVFVSKCRDSCGHYLPRNGCRSGSWTVAS